MDIGKLMYAHAMDILSNAVHKQPQFWLVPHNIWNSLMLDGRVQTVLLPTGSRIYLLLGYPIVRTRAVQDLYLECVYE